MDKRKAARALTLLLFLLCCTLPLRAKSTQIGLALSGGGAKSVSQIGVLQVIDSLQIPIDIISGTSMGSIIGALYACGYSGDEIQELFLQTDWQKLFNEAISRQDFAGSKKRWKPFTALYLQLSDNFTPLLPSGILHGSHIINKFFDMTYPAHSVRDFSQLPIPFFCKTTDLTNTKSVVLDKGHLHQALRASMSLPSIFSPMRLDSNTFVDGGLLDNLPAGDLAKKGVPTIIGVKTTFDVEQDKKEDLISVLQKSIGVSINGNVERAEKDVTILIYPRSKESAFILDFEKATSLIGAGKQEALKHIDELKKLSNPQKFKQLQQKKREFKNSAKPLKLEKVSVRGNKHLSQKTIFSLVNLDKNKITSKKDVLQICKELYDTDYFEYCYPLLDDENLVIVVKEKLRQKVGFYAKYNDFTKLSLGALLRVNNRILNNSNLLANFEFGGKTEADLDFVKNFGNRWGAYLRTFGSYQKQPFHLYDKNDFDQTRRKEKQETNATLGVGMYTNKSTILEGYYFYYLSHFDEDVRQYGLADNSFVTNGLGVKVYYEYLDDSYMPMDGESILSKFHFSNKSLKSDADYQKFLVKYDKLIPFVSDKFSVKIKLEYGNLSTNSPLPLEHDPFYLGGIDNFLGAETNSIITPVYKLGYLGMRFKGKSNLYWDIGANFADLRNKDYWNVFTQKYSTYRKGYGTTLTYYQPFFTTKISASINGDADTFFYFSLGYNFDSFEFSKK